MNPVAIFKINDSTYSTEESGRVIHLPSEEEEPSEDVAFSRYAASTLQWTSASRRFIAILLGAVM